ncbi:MAG: O-antigen ligase family protein, partial [Gemmatimonadales bacterium]
MTGAVSATPDVASPETGVRVVPLVRWALYATVFLIPLEWPDKLPFEVSTLAGSAFLLTTLLQPVASFAWLPWAMCAFAIYFFAEMLAMVIQAGGYPAGVFMDQVAKSSLLFILWVLFAWACSNLLRNERMYRGALWALVVGCLIRSALPLAGIARTAHVQGTGGERVTALGQNANQSAHVLAIGLLVFTGLTYVQAREPSRLRVLGWGAVLLIAAGMVQTGSRGGLVVFSVGLMVYLMTGRTLRLRIRNVGVALLGFGAILFLISRSEVMQGRLARAEEGSFSQREHIFPTLVGMFREKPLLGWGPITNKYELASRLGDAIHDRRDAHNILLEVLTSTGLAGTIPFCFGLWLCLRSAWTARAGPRGVVPLAILLAVLAGNMSENRISGPMLWLILGCALASGSVIPARPSPRAPGIDPGHPPAGRWWERLLPRPNAHIVGHVR